MINILLLLNMSTPIPEYPLVSSAFAVRRDYCLRMALHRNGRLIFLDHRENGNGQQVARYFHFLSSTQRRKFSLKQSARKEEP